LIYYYNHNSALPSFVLLAPPPLHAMVPHITKFVSRYDASEASRSNVLQNSTSAASRSNVLQNSTIGGENTIWSGANRSNVLQNSTIDGANTNGNTTPAAARSNDGARRISQSGGTATTKKTRVMNKGVTLLAPHKLQQECKYLAAMVAYSIVCEKHKGMKVNEIDDAVKEYCHGAKHKDIIALFSLMLKADAPFSDMWVKNTDGSGQEELVLNPQLYPSPRYVAGVSLNQSSLRAKSKDTGIIATGRALVAMAKKGIANNKKALAFTKAFLDQNGNLPSGTTAEDLYDFVNKEM